MHERIFSDKLDRDLDFIATSFFWIFFLLFFEGGGGCLNRWSSGFRGRKCVSFVGTGFIDCSVGPVFPFGVSCVTSARIPRTPCVPLLFPPGHCGDMCASVVCICTPSLFSGSSSYRFPRIATDCKELRTKTHG